MKFYDEGKTADEIMLLHPRIVFYAEREKDPKIFFGSNVEYDAKAMAENGYGLLGGSFFSGTSMEASTAHLVEQAKKVKADPVVSYIKYIGTAFGTIPLTLPKDTYVTTHNYGSIYGFGGSPSYSGFSTAVIHGTETVNIPYSRDYYSYGATFWKKIKTPPIFGVYARDLPAHLKQRTNGNKGVLVILVIKKSPAFWSDVLEGDVILAINNTTVVDLENYLKICRKDSLSQAIKNK